MSEVTFHYCEWCGEALRSDMAHDHSKQIEAVRRVVREEIAAARVFASESGRDPGLIGPGPDNYGENPL